MPLDVGTGGAADEGHDEADGWPASRWGIISTPNQRHTGGLWWEVTTHRTGSPGRSAGALAERLVVIGREVMPQKERG